jgi:hypothetical protein
LRPETKPTDQRFTDILRLAVEQSQLLDAIRERTRLVVGILKSPEIPIPVVPDPLRVEELVDELGTDRLRMLNH